VLVGARPAASDRAPLGAGFRLEYRVHAGAWTEVWRGVDAQGRTVAVKLAAHTVAGGAPVRRLRAEYGLLARLAHPSIVRPIAWVDEPSRVALVTEYLPGGDLVSLAGAAPRHWAGAAVAVLEALTVLHSKGIVHRDVKARNVMFDAAGRGRLIDFGSAAPVGRPRDDAGTTPAHRYGHSGLLSANDDLFAFAVLLYELMAARLPFPPDSQDRAGAVTSPLPETWRGRASLEALEALVLQSLTGSDPAGIGSLRAYRDGIESVLADEWNRP
jgi:serine/threonine protein kinase